MPGFFMPDNPGNQAQKKILLPSGNKILIIPIIMLKPTSGLEHLDKDNL
jgi:hypothetical protein